MRVMVISKQSGCKEGFTLLEILVTILISAVLALILAQVMTNQPWRSYRPIQMTKDSLELRNAMENITSDYRNLFKNDFAPLMTLKANINREDDFPGYWSGNEIVASQQCIDDPTSTEDHECQSNDTLFKVTLSKGSQSLTALFTK